MPASARRARRFVAEVLHHHDADHVSEVCVLLVSELVANAVRYARSDVELRIDFIDEAVRIGVHDHSDVRPVARSVEVDSVSGRGLGLVDTLSSAWGIDLTGRGKEVWFEVKL